MFEGIGFLNNFRVFFTGISSACLTAEIKAKLIIMIMVFKARLLMIVHLFPLIEGANSTD